eukprot:jgi/Mesvir1/5871/Mv25162-RA.1
MMHWLQEPLALNCIIHMNAHNLQFRIWRQRHTLALIGHGPTLCEGDLRILGSLCHNINPIITGVTTLTDVNMDSFSGLQPSKFCCCTHAYMPAPARKRTKKVDLFGMVPT